MPKDIAQRIKLIDFGGFTTESSLHGFRSVSVGHISDSKRLALLYSAVDCVVVPSMVESFGQVAAESLACCTPVVCFDTSGLRDIVQHEKSGLVAEAFAPNSLADRMLTIIKMPSESRRSMGLSGKQHIISQFSYPIVAKKYLKVLHDAENIKKIYIIGCSVISVI